MIPKLMHHLLNLQMKMNLNIYNIDENKNFILTKQN